MTTQHKDPRAVIEQLVAALEYVSQFLGDDNAAMLHVPAAIAAGHEALELRTCTWTQHDDVHMPSAYETECGALWSFVDGGPSDNGTKFCHGCGGHVCEPVGINGLTEAETSASMMSVRGLSAPIVGLQSVHDAITNDPSLCEPAPSHN